MMWVSTVYIGSADIAAIENRTREVFSFDNIADKSDAYCCYVSPDPFICIVMEKTSEFCIDPFRLATIALRAPKPRLGLCLSSCFSDDVCGTRNPLQVLL